MKWFHTPQVDARYWTAVTLASVFGTNMGDLLAHNSGLGIARGLAVLALLALIVFVLERFEERRHEIYYWLVILLIRTGATNIADLLAYKVRVPETMLTALLAMSLALFGWAASRSSSLPRHSSYALPDTNAAYWLAMLTAGVFGTVVGDICEHRFGEGISAVVLTLVLFAVLLAGRGRAASIIALYWTTIATARTSGTAIGDWLAENKIVHIGLPAATLISGVAFVAVLTLWKVSGTTGSPLEEIPKSAS